YRDAWFIGFTPDLIVGVWVGNDDSSPMRRVTGGSLPAGIWRDFVMQAGNVRNRSPQPSSAPRVASGSRSGLAAEPAAGTTRSDALRGPVVVLDTATLDVAGQLVRLFGVEGVPGRMTRQFVRYLRNDEAVCEPTTSGGFYRCRVGDQDLS